LRSFQVTRVDSPSRPVTLSEGASHETGSVRTRPGARRGGEAGSTRSHTLSLSEDTIKHHLTNIFDKTGVSNRLEVALFATHHGMVS
jgi:hypothetical protein